MPAAADGGSSAGCHTAFTASVLTLTGATGLLLEKRRTAVPLALRISIVTGPFGADFR